MKAIAHRGWRPLAAVVACAALAMASAPPASGGDAAARRGEGARVRIAGFAFRPASLSVRRGARVVFVNRDPVAHNATLRGSFRSGRIRPGRSAAVRFGRRGTYRYICTIHPEMHGKIVVR